MEITTYSMWQLFKNCRKKYKERYENEIVPFGQLDHNLFLGSVIHNALETWYKTGDALKTIDEIPDDQLLAKAMMVSYIEKYKSEPFEVIFVEKQFQGDIINPKTGHKSNTFELWGKVDVVVKQKGLYYIMEHKTASNVNANYLDKLWTDFQTILYSDYIEKTTGLKISGIIYNILGKSGIIQGKGETEEEYKERYENLCAKNKSGKSSAKQKIAESNEDFYNRLLKNYKEKDYFIREYLYIPKNQFKELQFELWDLTQSLLEARREGRYYKNSEYCFNWKKECGYYALCKSCDNPLIRENYYEHKPAHSELEIGDKENGQIKKDQSFDKQF